MKNQKGISLIALIITIIVIIILAAIVISSAVNTPEQANWAKFCGNYAEIQSAVSTKTAEVYGNAMLSTVAAAKPSMTQVLVSVCTEASLTIDGTYTAFPTTNVNALAISSTNQLGLSGYTFTTGEWAVKSDGVLYNVAGVANPNASNARYVTPTVQSAATGAGFVDIVSAS